MKRSRASLILFLMTLCCALHTVSWSCSRAATTEVRPLQKLCTAEWSPLANCPAEAARSASALASHGNVTLVNSSASNACHPEALSCYYQTGLDYAPGVDCFGSPVVAVSHETDSYPIEEYVYGDPAKQATCAVASEADNTDCYGEYDCLDEFDCGVVYQPKIYREDISALASDPRHSTGLQLAVDINANNDGLAEARLPSIRQSTAPRLANNAGANYDYGDSCDFEACQDEADACAAADRLAHDLEDLCGAGHCQINTERAIPVVTSDKEPLDLPPQEPAAIDPTEYGYEYEYNYADEYQYNYEDDYSYGYEADYGYDDDYGYEADETYGAATEYESADDYGYGYTDDEAYADESLSEPADLPPGEQIIDDMPPGETLPAQASYDAYDVECYGEYADVPAKPWVEPGCDEQQDFAGQDWCDGLSDDERSWGVGREYRKQALDGEQQSRELLRSTARVLNQLGKSLVSLAKSLDEQVEPVADSQPQSIVPGHELYPWPATIGRNPKIDPPLGL